MFAIPTARHLQLVQVLSAQRSPAGHAGPYDRPQIPRSPVSSASAPNFKRSQQISLGPHQPGHGNPEPPEKLRKLPDPVRLGRPVLMLSIRLLSSYFPVTFLVASAWACHRPIIHASSSTAHDEWKSRDE